MDYYETLQVPHDASEVQIRKAYFLIARQYHPDKNNGETLEIFTRADKAYRVLSDPAARSLYDNGIIESSNQSPTQSRTIDVAPKTAVEGGFVRVPFAIDCASCARCTRCKGMGRVFIKVVENKLTTRKRIECRCIGGFAGDPECPHCSVRLRVPKGVASGATLGIIRDVRMVAQFQLPSGCWLEGAQLCCSVTVGLADFLCGFTHDGPFGRVTFAYTGNTYATIGGVNYVFNVVYPPNLDELKDRLAGLG